MKSKVPRKFLEVIGYIFIVGAILGFIGVLGPTSSNSIFGAFWWLSYPVSLIYLVTGIVSVYSAYAMADEIVVPLAFTIGVVGFFVGLYGLVWSSRIMGINLPGGLGGLFNLIVGGYGVWSVSADRFALMRRCRMGDTEACKIVGMPIAR